LLLSKDALSWVTGPILAATVGLVFSVVGTVVGTLVGTHVGTLVSAHFPDPCVVFTWIIATLLGSLPRCTSRLLSEIRLLRCD